VVSRSLNSRGLSDNSCRATPAAGGSSPRACESVSNAQLLLVLWCAEMDAGGRGGAREEPERSIWVHNSIGLGPSDALQGLRRSELGLHRCLALQVEQALLDVKPWLESGDFELIRSVLRHQLASNPVLLEYVRLLQVQTGT
jgi:hypothetical protein